jgi:hypothetical protein
MALALFRLSPCVAVCASLPPLVAFKGQGKGNVTATQRHRLRALGSAPIENFYFVNNDVQFTITLSCGRSVPTWIAPLVYAADR